jgi:hypothetical protein
MLINRYTYIREFSYQIWDGVFGFYVQLTAKLCTKIDCGRLWVREEGCIDTATPSPSPHSPSGLWRWHRSKTSHATPPGIILTAPVWLGRNRMGPMGAGAKKSNDRYQAHAQRLEPS